MKENKLLPCPFCGGTADWYIATNTALMQALGEPSDDNTIECEECGCTTPVCHTLDKAVTVWNNRTSQHCHTVNDLYKDKRGI